MSADQPTHVRLREAAAAMGISRHTLQRMVQAGEVPAWAIVRSGRKQPHLYIARAWFERAPVTPAANTIEAGAFAFAVTLKPMAVGHG